MAQNGLKKAVFEQNFEKKSPFGRKTVVHGTNWGDVYFSWNHLVHGAKWNGSITILIESISTRY